jgi:hypothetical protein
VKYEESLKQFILCFTTQFFLITQTFLNGFNTRCKQRENVFLTRAAQEALHKYMAARCAALVDKKPKKHQRTKHSKAFG